MIVLGIDLSIACTGYCLIEYDVSSYSIIKYGKIVTKKKEFETEDLRLNYISNVFEEVLDGYIIDDVVIEDQFVGRNPQVGLKLSKLKGSVMRTMYYHDLTMTYMTPAEWRKLLGLSNTKGIDKKRQSYDYVVGLGLFNEEYHDKGKMKNDDVCDSICVALSFIKRFQNKCLENKM